MTLHELRAHILISPYGHSIQTPHFAVKWTHSTMKRVYVEVNRAAKSAERGTSSRQQRRTQQRVREGSSAPSCNGCAHGRRINFE